jgi:hypothetical protein
VEYSIRHTCETWSPSINRAREITHNGFGRWSISKCGRGYSLTAAPRPAEPGWLLAKQRLAERCGQKNKTNGLYSFFCPYLSARAARG